jgi:hypothetical protein
MSSRFGQFKTSIVAVLDSGDAVLGVGVLVSRRHLLTCAHVVAAALGHPVTAPSIPRGSVRITFPLLDGGQDALSATVELWQPVAADGGGDIAGLVLNEAPPPTVGAPELVVTEEPWGHEFRSYGFPSNLPAGLWTDGRILESQRTGWIQLEGLVSQGGRVQPGFSGGPVWDATLEGVVGIVVAAGPAADTKLAWMIPSALLIAAWPDVLAARSVPASPYRGLLSFRERDAGVFFGRERFVETLVDRARTASFMAVLGSSGSGKSSVVLAGLVPRLRRSGDWIVTQMRPGRDPFRALDMAFRPLLDPYPTASEHLKGIFQGLLYEAVEQILTDRQESRILLVIDQFEEVFTLCSDETTRARFIALLVETSSLSGQEAEPRLTIAVTMRADFLGQALNYRVLADTLEGTDVKLGPMTRDELRLAIESPARAQGVSFEEGLVERIVEDVGDERGSLPLLEFALTKLWERQERRRMTHAHYESLGGVDKALAHQADSIYESLSEGDKRRARRVLLQLVRPGEGTSDSRRLAIRPELSTEDWQMIQKLASKRLVVTDRDPAGQETAEVAHEALVTSWAPLRTWLSADRAFRLWQERLRESIRHWNERNNDPSVLPRGALLAEAEAWLDQRPEDLGSEERSFIEAAHRLQAEENERYRLLYESAVAQQLTAQAHLSRTRDSEGLSLSLLLAIEAVRRSPSFEADHALRLTLAALQEGDQSEEESEEARTILSRHDAARVEASDRAVSAGWLSPVGDGWLATRSGSRTGDRVAAGGEQGPARVFDLTKATELRQLAHEGLVNAVALSPDGRLLVTGGDDGAIRTWDVEEAVVLAVMGHPGLINAVAFGPDGERVATAGHDGTARVWHAPEGQELIRVPVGGPVRNVGFSDDGAFLATATHRPQLWPLRPGDLVDAACRRLTRNLSDQEWHRYIGDEPYRPTCSGLPLPVPQSAHGWPGEHDEG